jgi:hypothetical protein
VNASVTGSPWKLPYLEYDERYATVPPLTFLAHRPPAAEPIPDRLRQYDAEYAIPSAAEPPRTLRTLAERWWIDVRFYFAPALAAVALAGFLAGYDRWRRVALATLAATWLSAAVSVVFHERYQAPAAAAALFLGVGSAHAFSKRLSHGWRRLFVAAVAAAHAAAVALAPPFGVPPPELAAAFDRVDRALEAPLAAPGPDLVFVSYDRAATVHAEFVFNPADLSNAAVLFARDRGADNPRLVRRFPERRPWRLHVSPDAVEIRPLYGP